MTEARWRAAFASAIAVQVVVLYWPWTVPQPPGGFGWDKLVHFVIFAAAGYAGVRAGFRPLLVLGLLLVHAPLSEWIQGTFLPRYADIGDVLADVVGALCGTLTAWALPRNADHGWQAPPPGRKDGTRAGT